MIYKEKICLDCGVTFKVRTQNLFIVKRCELCQLKKNKQKYTEYQRIRRQKIKEASKV